MKKTKTPLEKLKWWREEMIFKLPIVGSDGHFTMYDIKKLDEIIELFE